MSVILEGNKGNYIFDPFSDKTKIGEGGMGLVYLGEESDTKKKVAIKVLFKELSSNPVNIERALKESSINIDHKNIIKMIEFVEKDGIYHIISEYLEGKSLDKFIESQKDISKEKAINIVNEVLTGLSVLHRSKPPIVHRDIKPSNIFLCDSGEVKIMDFGVARSLEGGNRRLTKTGSVVGTPFYAAPEQIRSQTDLINPTTDIYSLGVTLYELLSGTIPFEGKSEYDTLKMQVEEPLPPHPKIPQSLFSIISKATAKNQKDRYKNTNEFKKALMPFMPKAIASKPSNPQKVIKGNLATVLNFIFISLAIIFAGLFFNSQSTLSKERSDAYYDKYDLQSKLDILNQSLDLASSSFPLIIDGISLRLKSTNGNILNDYPDKLYAGGRVTLQPLISYRSLLSQPSSHLIYYKIYMPDESMLWTTNWQNDPIPFTGKYSNKSTINIPVSNESQSYEFGGLTYNYKRGRYRIEFWTNDKCLGAKYFTLN